MNDQERLTDFISSEKKMSMNYGIFASECTSIPLRDAFLNMIDTSHKNQTNLFQTSVSKGWYQVEAAPADKISQAYTKFSNQCPQ